LVLTLKREVCGRNCVSHTRDGEEGDGEGKTEEGFVANLRDLDDEWVCPCCGTGDGAEARMGKGKGKGRRCISVLDVDEA
jgi:rubredoxin